MSNLWRRVAFLALLPACFVENYALAQTAPIARFGTIEVDESGAKPFGYLVRSKEIERQIKDLKGDLIYQPGALGFYRVGFESTGTRENGRVRAIVLIVAQFNSQTLLAHGESTQSWPNVPISSQTPRWPGPAFPSTATPQSPPYREDVRAYPYPFPVAPTQQRGNGCANDKRGQDGNSKAARTKAAREEREAKEDEKKKETKAKPDEKTTAKPAPNPKPERAQTRPKPQIEPHRPEKPRVIAPQTWLGHPPDPDPSDKGDKSAPNPRPGPGDSDPDAPGLGPNPNPLPDPNRHRNANRPLPTWRPLWEIWDQRYGSYSLDQAYLALDRDAGARWAFERALELARADAESDLIRQFNDIFAEKPGN